MDPHPFGFTPVICSTRRHSPAQFGRTVPQVLLLLSIAALAGCSDREPPTAVSYGAQRPTLDVVGADYVVTTTADAGAGSLRQAILDANAAGVAKTIAFDIPRLRRRLFGSQCLHDHPRLDLAGYHQLRRPHDRRDGAIQSPMSGNDAVRVMRVGSGAIATVRRPDNHQGLITVIAEDAADLWRSQRHRQVRRGDPQRGYAQRRSEHVSH